MLRWLLAVTAAVVVTMSGCGGDDRDAAAPSTAGTTATSPPATTAEAETDPVTATTEPPAASTNPVTATTAPTEPGNGSPPGEAPLEPRPGTFVVGAVDDAARHGGPMLAQLADAGFGALGITSYWDPGRSAPTDDELTVLRATAARADALDLRVFLAVFHRGSATTPLTPAARRQFARYVAAIVRDVPSIRDVIVGNEPNLNRFWLPQFDAQGRNVASGAYLALLSETYDAAKAEDAQVRIWGGALAPRGNDRPNGIRHTQSPAAFISGMGEALRASGRSRPPMDGFAFHPYAETSSTPPDLPHDPRSRTIGLADHERLRDLLREAFGRALPLLYSEFGVETRIPPRKQPLYEGAEVARPVDERTQAEYYRRALELASCQTGVVGMLLFHSQDEPFLTGFQSGVHYVDGEAKASLPAVRRAILDARDGC